VGLERTAFSRRFAAVVGEPFSLHLRQRLMAEARRRLVASPRRITDVALDLGFADPMAFSAAFRRAVGCSPQAFRRRALAAAP
jgi:AraC-like DNA-binding protein